jgi:hypothetical protein
MTDDVSMGGRLRAPGLTARAADASPPICAGFRIVPGQHLS